MSAPAFSAADVRAQLAGTHSAPAAQFAEPLAGFLNLLAKWSRVYNLTGFRDPKQLLDRVLLECLLLRDWLQGTQIGDVGSGAGLPGLPLAITEPQRQFTLIESRAKRVHFLRHVVGELALGNVLVEHGRAEDLPGGRSFDTLLGRAVAAPPQFLSLARALTGPGSRVVLLTSPDKGAEYRAAIEQSSADFTIGRIEPAGADGQYGVVVQLRRS